MKGGFCVSTVSIVCGLHPGSMAVVAGCTYWPGRRLARPRNVIVVKGGADGADGIFGARTDPDYPISSSAFTTEGDVDAYCRKECLCTTQATSEFPGILGPNRDPTRTHRFAPARRRSEAFPPPPRAPFRHNVPHPSGHRIGVD
jgi:hypothetical protein